MILGNQQATAQIYSVVDKRPILENYKDSLNAEQLTERALLIVINNILEYPQSALYHNLQGRVVLKYLIDESGLVKKYSIASGIGGGCDQAVLNAFEKLRNKLNFMPALRNNKAVAYEGYLPIQFKTDKKYEAKILLKNIDSWYQYMDDVLIITAASSGKKKILEQRKEVIEKINYCSEEHTTIDINHKKTSIIIDNKIGALKDIHKGNLDSLLVVEKTERNDSIFYKIETINEIKMAHLKICSEEFLFTNRIDNCSIEEFFYEVYRNTKYPAWLRKRFEQGYITLKYTIDKKGEISKPEVVKAYERLTESSIEGLNTTFQVLGKWNPTMVNGKAIDTNYLISFDYRILHTSEMK